MNPRLSRQIMRMYDIYSFVYGEKDPGDFFSQRSGRSLSSIEEELVSYLPLFDEVEEQKIIQETSSILGGKTHITNSKDFAAIIRKNPKLYKRIQAIGMRNYQYLIQNQFYNKARDIFVLSKYYEFPAEYESVTPANFMGIKVTCLEQYKYGGSFSYRSMLYHLIRHLNNLTGEETQSEINELAKRTFSGKKVLELGSGPGFFLYTLRELGADVTGVDINENFREQTAQAKLNILYGDAKDLVSLVRDKTFDVVFSKDFLSFAVTGHNAEQIMMGVYDILREGGLTLHQIEYRKTSEERYLEIVKRFCEVQKYDFEKMRDTFSKLDSKHKEYILRKNILNISLEHLQSIGFKPFTRYRLDVDEFLTITLGK